MPCPRKDLHYPLVSAWVADSFDDRTYEGVRLNDPDYRGDASECVIRGGGFISGPAMVRCADRNFGPAERQNDGLGIRLVLTSAF